MPMAIPLLGAAFLAAGSIMTAVGVTAAIAGISLATIATVAGVALMAVSMLTMQVPKPSSAGTQLDTKMSVKAPVPVLYGHTATGGTLVYRELSGNKNDKLFLAIALSAAGPIAGVEYAYANDAALNFSGNPSTSLSMVSSTTPVSKKLYRGKLGMRYLRGDTPSTTTVAQGFAPHAAPKNPGLASGHAMALVYADYDTDEFPQGLPKMLWTARGVRVYDPRKDSSYPGGAGSHRLSDPATWEFSENPYLCALHWTLGKFHNGRKVCGVGAPASEVDIAAFVRGANVADANGWKCGGVVTTQDDKFAVLSTILAAGGGVPIARGAQISCHVNTPLTTTATITAHDIVRDVEIQNSSSLRSRYNTVIPTYREPSQFWEMISGEQVSTPVYIDEDSGFVTTREVEFTMVQQARQAHQLATYNLVNSREMLTFTLGLKLRSLAFRVGDAVLVNVPEIAAGQIKCLVINREYNPSDQIVTVTLKSENDAKHAFALGQSQIAPPTIGLSGYDPSDMAAPEPGSWLVQGGTLSSNTGVRPIIRINGANDNPYTSAIIIEYRPVGSTGALWFQAGSYSRDTTSIEILNVTALTAYDVAISYRSITGAVSDRTIYSPAIAGDERFAWSAVDGSGKPQDNATVGAPVGTPVGDRPAEEVIDQLDDVIEGMRLMPDLVTGMLQEPIARIDALRLDYGTVTSSLAATAAQSESNTVAIRDLKSFVDATGGNVSQDILALYARAGANEAALLEEARLRADEDSASSWRLSQAETRVGNTETLISSLATSVNDGASATATSIDQLGVRITDERGAREGAISTEQQARINADGVLSGRIDTISADTGSLSSVVQNVSQAISDEASTRGQQINAVQSRLNNVGGASIESRMETLAQIDGRLQSAWTIKVQQDWNGHHYVAGGGLAMQDGVSSISWLADSFRIMAPGQTPRQIFYADEHGVRIDNAVIGTLRVGTNQIEINAVTVTHFARRTGQLQGSGVVVDALTYNIFTPHDCDVIVLVNGVQGFPSGDRTWNARLLGDGQQLAGGGGEKTTDTFNLAGTLRATAGNHELKVTWSGQSSVRLADLSMTILEARR